jgi:hypothetical protein
VKNISSNAELQDAIRLLEAEQAIKLKLMKEQFHLAYESLKPAKFIENTLKDIVSSPYLVNKIMVTSIGLVTGYLSQKAITRRSSGKLRKLFGYMLQFGITNLIAQNPKAIKMFSQYIFQHIFPKTEMNSVNRD